MLSEEGGITIHIVNELTEGFVFIGSDEPDRSQPVHLANATKHVLVGHPDTTPHLLVTSSSSLG